MSITKVELTEDQIEEVIAAASAEKPLGHIERLWDFVLGEPVSTAKHPINVNNYKIPATQAIRIANAVTAKLPENLRAAVTMEWVNLAPGATS